MSALSVFHQQGLIVLSIRDDHGTDHAVQIDRHGLFELLLKATLDLQADPANRTASSAYPEELVLRSFDPAFDVGYREGGGCILAVKPDVIPPLHFDLSPDALAELIAALAAVVDPQRRSGGLN